MIPNQFRPVTEYGSFNVYPKATSSVLLLETQRMKQWVLLQNKTLIWIHWIFCVMKYQIVNSWIFSALEHNPNFFLIYYGYIRTWPKFCSFILKTTHPLVSESITSKGHNTGVRENEIFINGSIDPILKHEFVLSENHGFLGVNISCQGDHLYGQ